LLSGAEAAQLGLVNRSMPKESLVEETRKIAAQVAQGPTAAFMQSKRLVRRIDEEALGLFAVLRCEAQAQGAAGRSADYKEGISAFQQKRAPKFVGR
ncbi:MAG TPA: enoyl-CoA hydratase-related protein, partial [Patescibacteria group bacterium]|nr:enoyl-CoA hydratase-related protein [Patescibacteria group bacterium]